MGLDVGSVSAKMVVIVPSSLELQDLVFAGQPVSVFHLRQLQGYRLPPQKILGNPILVAEELLQFVVQQIVAGYPAELQVTGSQAKRVAHLLNVPHVNEFKAISRGVVALEPEAHTILEIGGDGSRFINISFDSETEQLVIQDYMRNGECAAGTGSFIDQQAARLKFDIEEISDLVLNAGSAANIAGRCSVFAKSDMIHAQQRGYSPGAIFKGLCEAVVRNYKGTVLRGKALRPKIVFVGGVASNVGVVQAMRSILNLREEELCVPDLGQHAAALGCALLVGGAIVDAHDLSHLRSDDSLAVITTPTSPRLDLSQVRFPDYSSKSWDFSLGPVTAYLGLDIGSVSTNLVLLDESGWVMDEIYTQTEGRPVQVVQRELTGWHSKWSDKVKIVGVGSTGSGRELIGELVGADAIHDEITAHKIGASFIARTLLGEGVDTIFEIGGQDSKFISVEDDVVVDFTMNEACAAGTGSFLEEQAAKLGISIKDDFARLALQALRPVRMGERCTVFMEKDVTTYLQQGLQKSDIAAGLAYAVVQNYLNRVVRGRKIGNAIYFQGGTAYNHAVAAAFTTTLQKPIVVPPHNGVMGAIGAALLARDKMTKNRSSTRFRGFDLSAVQFTVRQFRCKACANQCDIQEITIEGEKTYWGDKCSERYRKKRKTARRTTLPDLFRYYQELLLQGIPGPDGLGIRIGMPRTMYFYDRFPFWKTFFAQLGAEVVFSDATHRDIIVQGRELCTAEPCFPVIAGHGHFLDVFDKKADYVFMPIAINSETDFSEHESWNCPWGQTLPLVVKNTLKDSEMTRRLLTPVIRFRDGKEAVKKALHGLAKELRVSRQRSDKAVDVAYLVQRQFRDVVKRMGARALALMAEKNLGAVVIVGRPYNVYDAGLNLNIPSKLREDYGVNVIPMDFLPFEGIDIRAIHENMFWNYGRQILQASRFVGENERLHLIYFTNFKCGPDSYIKHFVRDAVGAPYLTLQFDDHSNDAGILTRCEAYLQSKNLL